MAQGAKPGEGGQLPGAKVYPWIAKTRHSTPGVGLISPPPHHDIYSIEDLAELIHDLKNANHQARISVKLVQRSGRGHDCRRCGQGPCRCDPDLRARWRHRRVAANPASNMPVCPGNWAWPRRTRRWCSTICAAGWRSRPTVSSRPGAMWRLPRCWAPKNLALPPRPLVSMGCIMMRVCHLDTCPVGVATQNPELRKNFVGQPEDVINFMFFIAEELREIHGQARLPHDRRDGRAGRSSWSRARRSSTGRPAASTSRRCCGNRRWATRSVAIARSRRIMGWTSRSIRPRCWSWRNRRWSVAKRCSATLPIRNVNRVVGTHGGQRNHPPLWRRRVARRHDSLSLPGLGWTELWRVYPARAHA